MVKQKNHCHELKFCVKSFRTYCDQVGRTLADLMEDGVKVLSLYLDCFGKTSWLPVSPSVWLVLFLSTGGLFLCLVGFLCCFHLSPCYLTWLVTNGDLLFLLLFFLSVLLMHLSFEMDRSYPFCYWNECVTLCLWSVQFSEHSCAASKLCHKFSSQFLARSSSIKIIRFFVLNYFFCT